MAKSPLTEEDKEQIRKLYQETDLSYAAIALRYGVSAVTINRICRPEMAARQAASTKLSRKNYAAREAALAKERYKSVLLKFHREYDADVIEQLEQQENKIDYVRTLILQDIQQQNQKD